MPDRAAAARPVEPTGLPDYVRAQNRDGGWGYAGGDSWTEPTAFVVLSLRGAPGAETAVRRAITWLEANRRSDGGWSPHSSVRESTWVSALAALALHRSGRLARNDPVLAWLLRVEGSESGWVHRARRFLLGGDNDEVRYPGWPWFPGASSWVMPTALTILVLREVSPLAPQLGFARRIEEGCRFLLSRQCTDGGWNHGSSRALGYHGSSYPETTGVALLALRGRKSEEVAKARRKAQEHLEHHPGVEGWSWLQLGLRAHGVTPRADTPPVAHRLDARESAIHHMALTAIRGRDPWGVAP